MNLGTVLGMTPAPTRPPAATRSMPATSTRPIDGREQYTSRAVKMTVTSTSHLTQGDVPKERNSKTSKSSVYKDPG